MKNTKTCPKCESTDLVRIPGSVGVYGVGNNITVGLTAFSSVKVTRFLCCDCGFSEEWVEGQKYLDRIRKKYR
ncbi:MAG: hypothetical protein K8S55_15880 [Phycisphaerae bacterium]|nr:hypothetical protein [Phycisphaerae bacterium]